ncbi:hypothetical protein FTO74_14825 [Granulicella sp. WH15]|uniref:DUF5666 domain-containing protein n=1 Tax=Granulicella sp. WH15 TaxID=2602070 RepID=UPI0013677733|nr:DUF5666 domain-containing protein [Granulicella sp. WH15]QHN04492.1 hypothetical protein FTO74_14825 [Granulicella sp. WH15]
MNVRSGLVALLSLVLALQPGHAQEEDGGGAAAMGGGRMVRGTVTAVAPDHLTLKTEAGETYQVALTPNTQLRKGRDPIKAADVHVGDGAGAMGVLDAPNKTVHALFVGVVDAEQIRKMREAMGKTYIAGKVTAIDELKLTILRQDNVTQVIAVDEDTSFRRGGRGMRGVMNGGGPEAVPAAPSAPAAGGQGGESITLADIKVGDSVAGQGAIKGGVFVPTQLAVMAPGAGRRRRGDAPAATPGEPK